MDNESETSFQDVAANNPFDYSHWLFWFCVCMQILYVCECVSHLSLFSAVQYYLSEVSFHILTI